MRINCNGSEIDIIEELMNANLLRSSHSFLVDFDILKLTQCIQLKIFFLGLKKWRKD